MFISVVLMCCFYEIYGLHVYLHTYIGTYNSACFHVHMYLDMYISRVIVSIICVYLHKCIQICFGICTFNFMCSHLEFTSVSVCICMCVYVYTLDTVCGTGMWILQMYAGHGIITKHPSKKY